MSAASITEQLARARRALSSGQPEQVITQSEWPQALAGASEQSLAELIAIANAACGRNFIAAIQFQQLLDARPGNVAHAVNLSAAWLHLNRPDEALALLTPIAVLHPDHQLLHFNLGLAAYACRDFHLAAQALANAASNPQDDQVATIYRIRALQQQGLTVEADVVLAKFQVNLHALPEDCLPILGQALLYAQKFDEAKRVIQEGITRTPDDPSGSIDLALLLERQNEIEAADEALGRVDSRWRALPAYCLAKGKLLVRRQRLDDAMREFDLASRALDADRGTLASDELQNEIVFARVKLLDRLGRYDEAFHLCAEAKLKRLDQNRADFRIDAEVSASVWLNDDKTLDSAVRREQVFNLDIRSPIFIVGFPRSGTTLLDKILDSHTRLQVLEEKPALESIALTLADSSGSYQQALVQASPTDLARLRADYWTRVSSYIDLHQNAQLVDKFPLNIAHLHLGMILFPKARWVVALRDPRDVVLSCFMQNLSFTSVVQGFWSVEQTAGLYKQIMSRWVEQSARLAPTTVEIRYERMVVDFEAEVRRLIQALDLPWEDGMLDFQKKAARRPINTPSYDQVIQPIYGHAIGRWRHYLRHLRGAIEILGLTVERFGYTSE